MTLRILTLSILVFVPQLATAQVTELGGNVLATAIATVPTCMDNQGGGGFTDASASCSAMGYAAVAAAQSSRTSSIHGGTVFASASSQAASVGGLSNLTASGLGDAGATSSWTIGSSTYYSTLLNTTGTATASFTDGAIPFPPSGILAPDVYSLQANVTALSIAEDSNGVEVVTSGPWQASGEVTFAAVGAVDLIRGTVTASGLGAPGLTVEALTGTTVVAAAVTGNDGSYLLPNLPGSVTLRISDPSGALRTSNSGSLSPPLVFDTDLSPALLPALSGPMLLGLCATLLAAGQRFLKRVSTRA